ncbi:cytochrome C oxidase subunit II [Candidatus Francisella endociliophora]|uniref:Cytochrome C oxidase subunit II n=1 Tax=Candidatus Francisella endociliophora TaxID=653937 RepID=A0A097EMN1_9GAMM|nr:leucyl aminopeptidase family protein [Francisella sp. FSC1006]AIT08826.1 cytochrome C oxidase subunit II [Francisella sp. FSC1006]
MYVSTQLKCFKQVKSENSLPIYLICKKNFEAWLIQQDSFSQKIINQAEQKKTTVIIPNSQGDIEKIVCRVTDDMFSIAELSNQLPKGDYHIEYCDSNDLASMYIGFALGSYKFDKYKSKPKEQNVKLYLPKEYEYILANIEANFIVRDMITTPAEEMGPADISNIVKQLANEFGASFEEIVGEELAKQGYMGIYTVGKGSHREPRLVRLSWGDDKHPLVSLVGKGVVFDTGGLDIKPSSGMLLMHKDMGGSANAIGLAYMIMKHKLPIRLNLVIPTVENAIDAKSYRPSDIIKMKNGTTVQVVNTDAEGRLILAEPLFVEAQKKPKYLIDFATLTGAARVAVGPEISAFFCNDDEVSNDINKYGKLMKDQVWRLPLADCYRKNLETEYADISHADLSSPFAGAIKAALFMEHFVGLEDAPTWIHFDMIAWNLTSTPGRPKGGEMMAVRAMFEMLKDKFTH